MSWTTPADIKAKVQREWDRGRILAARLGGEPLFPLTVRLDRPDTKVLSERFQEVREWIAALELGSRTEQGFGYEIQWMKINHRQLGRNRVPQSAVVPSAEDALRMIGKQRQAERVSVIAGETQGAFPELRAWLVDNPLRILEHAEEWQRLVAVLHWFRAHPRSGLYLRQLDIAGVDTKFIETKKGILSELLDGVLPPEVVDLAATGVRGFEARYGLLAKPPLVRFRILDPRHYIQGLSDLTVSAPEFASLAATFDQVERVFITENETNGLAFPGVAHALVIFGLGYGLDRLHEIEWMRDKGICYWGDIDTHGFGILDRLRATFPAARSFLMNRETLLAHRALWVREGAGERHEGTLLRLTDEERALFGDLQLDRLGDRVRLEQERIAFGWLGRALGALRDP